MLERDAGARLGGIKQRRTADGGSARRRGRPAKWLLIRMNETAATASDEGLAKEVDEKELCGGLGQKRELKIRRLRWSGPCVNTYRSTPY